MDEGDDALGYEQARRLRAALAAARIARGEFWLYYFGLGGNVGEFEVDAYLNHSLMLTALDRDLLAQAANELFDEIPRHRAPYASDIREEQNARHGSTEDRDQSVRMQDSDVMDHDEREEPED